MELKLYKFPDIFFLIKQFGRPGKTIQHVLRAIKGWIYRNARILPHTTLIKTDIILLSLDTLKGWQRLKLNFTGIMNSSYMKFRYFNDLKCCRSFRTWKQMSLNDSMNSKDRAKLAVWDYPVRVKV